MVWVIAKRCTRPPDPADAAAAMCSGYLHGWLARCVGMASIPHYIDIRL